MRDEIVKDHHFEEVSDVKADSKNRVTLGWKSSYQSSVFYKVYRNALGQFLLDPQVTIPAHEQWLFKNPEAAKMVQRGLEDARKGRLAKAKEDFSKYLDEE